MTQEQVKELLSGGLEFLAGFGMNRFSSSFTAKSRGKVCGPKAIVRYDREAFLYAPGNVRITLDRDIRTGLGCVDFLNSEIFYMRTMEPGTVLEVKYDAYLPELVRMAVAGARKAGRGLFQIRPEPAVRLKSSEGGRAL